MSAYWIKRLNESDSRLHKEAVLDEALTLTKINEASSHIFLQLTYLAYNPFVTWGIKQIPVTEGIVDAVNPWSEFQDLLAKLNRRELTGHSARDAVADMSILFDSNEWNNFCRPVLLKDLRCGISEKTVNKVVKKTKYEIAVFGCQLATSCEGRPEMRGEKRLEPKLDGVRVLLTVIHNDFGEVVTTCFSRNGKIFDNFTHIEEQVSSNFTKLVRSIKNRWGGAFDEGFVLDGEVVGKSFNDLMKQARRKSDVQALDSVFSVFDIIPLADFRRGHWNTQLHKRVEILDNMRSAFDEMPNVELLPHIMVDLDTAAGRDQLNRYANDQVNSGFEGIMIKDLETPYECRRNTSWLKWKPVITVDLEVVDVEEGTGKNVGRLGALVCSGVDDGRTITVNVGSGFSDEQRVDIWSNRTMVVGQTVEVMADAVSKNQDGTYSLRFPRFVRFRDDK